LSNVAHLKDERGGLVKGGRSLSGLGFQLVRLLEFVVHKLLHATHELSILLWVGLLW
jgi:hypothetical protein